jgi:hypothetical protein
MRMGQRMWYYEGRQFDPENDLGDNVGFVYCITNLTDNRRYIGKKLFEFTRTKKVKGKKRKTKVKIKSDWEEYFGSNLALLADVAKLGQDKFKREIIHLCKTKGTCSYFEAKEIMARDAIISENYYNQWLSCKFSAPQIKL